MPVNRGLYISKHFQWDEFRSHDGTPVPERYVANVLHLVEQLEIIRSCFDRPMTIISGFRTPKHNKAVGGKVRSQHLTGHAADIVVYSVTSKELHKAIESLIATRDIPNGGLGYYRHFCHYDTRSKPTRWKG